MSFICLTVSPAISLPCVACREVLWTLSNPLFIAVKTLSTFSSISFTCALVSCKTSCCLSALSVTVATDIATVSRLCADFAKFSFKDSASSETFFAVSWTLLITVLTCFITSLNCCAINPNSSSESLWITFDKSPFAASSVTDLIWFTERLIFLASITITATPPAKIIIKTHLFPPNSNLKNKDGNNKNLFRNS